MTTMPLTTPPTTVEGCGGGVVCEAPHYIKRRKTQRDFPFPYERLLPHPRYCFTL